jgi:purine-binding chemotaxis protein CheW
VNQHAQDSPTQLCTFLLDGVLFGVDVRAVQEVLRLQEMTPVPLAPDVVSGLINLRGHIVTAIDLRARLELAARSDGAEPVNVVLRHGDSTVSLLVDDIGDVVTVDPSTFEPTPATLDARIKGVVRGVYKLKGELLLLMEPGLVLQLEGTGYTNSRRRA